MLALMSPPHASVGADRIPALGNTSYVSRNYNNNEAIARWAASSVLNAPVAILREDVGRAIYPGPLGAIGRSEVGREVQSREFASFCREEVGRDAPSIHFEAVSREDFSRTSQPRQPDGAALLREEFSRDLQRRQPGGAARLRGEFSRGIQSRHPVVVVRGGVLLGAPNPSILM